MLSDLESEGRRFEICRTRTKRSCRAWNPWGLNNAEVSYYNRTASGASRSDTRRTDTTELAWLFGPIKGNRETRRYPP